MTSQEINLRLSRELGIPLLTQCFLDFPSEQFATPHDEANAHKVEASLERLKINDEDWNYFRGKHPQLTDEDRQKGCLRINHWPLRLHDTPGGAFVVLEKLDEQGWALKIHRVKDKKCGPGWRVFCQRGKIKVVKRLDTFSETICAAAFECIERSAGK